MPSAGVARRAGDMYRALTKGHELIVWIGPTQQPLIRRNRSSLLLQLARPGASTEV
jgi:hypothetical protein